VGHQNSNGEEHQRFPDAEATLNSLVTSYQNHQSFAAGDGPAA
jgi:hypothetical protein